MTTKLFLQEQITEYLAERKPAVYSGWPIITEEELVKLGWIIETLIKTKYEKDCDGDLPLYAKLVDRTKEHHPFRSMLHGDPTAEGYSIPSFIDRLSTAAINLSIAENEVRLLADQLRMQLIENEKSNEREI